MVIKMRNNRNNARTTTVLLKVGGPFWEGQEVENRSTKDRTDRQRKQWQDLQKFVVFSVLLCCVFCAAGKSRRRRLLSRPVAGYCFRRITFFRILVRKAFAKVQANRKLFYLWVVSSWPSPTIASHSDVLFFGFSIPVVIDGWRRGLVWSGLVWSCLSKTQQFLRQFISPAENQFITSECSSASLSTVVLDF